jgi:[NiFe] hydrogenase assembly HybE family chaperone
MTDAGDDPAQLFEATFQRIAEERMVGLPILNPALAVAAVGFRPWQDYWIGVLVTPWFMNLMARPIRQDAAPAGADTVVALPSGEYQIRVSGEEGVGHYLSCPLISPMAQFADQEAALAVAREVLAQVFAAPAPPAMPEADLGRRGFLSAFLPTGKPK